MQKTRRTMLLAAGAGLASMSMAQAPDHAAKADPSTAEVDKLVRLSRDSNAALMVGDVDRYREMVSTSNDFTLMSPFGGKPSHADDITGQTWEAMKTFFRNGSFEQELVQSYNSRDMVVLATIERTRCEVGGLPMQDWALRVTLVYRRDAAGWQLVHRHADPLAGGIGLEQAAALARGHIVMSG